jgi:uncharacterized RDD family membrane protein YckC
VILPIMSALVTFVVAVLYLTGCWTVSGSTAGAVTMGLRVIDCVLFPIGLLWIVIDRQRRSLQDIVFRTRVVYSQASARVMTLLTPGTSPS